MPDSHSLTLILPLPPSVNGLYRTIPGGRGRPPRIILSADGRAWVKTASPMIQAQLGDWDKLTGLVEVHYWFYFLDLHRRDAFNYEKLLSDTLTKCGVWHDDCQIYDGHVHKRLDRASPRVEVIVSSSPG